MGYEQHTAGIKAEQSKNSARPEYAPESAAAQEELDAGLRGDHDRHQRRGGLALGDGRYRTRALLP